MFLFSSTDMHHDAGPLNPDFPTMKRTDSSTTASSVDDCIRELVPLPKLRAKKKSRRSESAAILTSSPNKQVLQEKQNKRRQKKGPARRKSNKGKSKVQVVNNEVAEEETVSCIYCDEPYKHPPNEDWLQCIRCNKWFHEDCGNESAVCDLCL